MSTNVQFKYTMLYVVSAEKNRDSYGFDEKLIAYSQLPFWPDLKYYIQCDKINKEKDASDFNTLGSEQNRLCL